MAAHRNMPGNYVIEEDEYQIAYAFVVSFEVCQQKMNIFSFKMKNTIFFFTCHNAMIKPYVDISFI